MEPRYSCPNCGTSIPFGIQFCVNCGTPLSWPAQQQMPPQSNYQQPPGYQQQIPPYQQQYRYREAAQYKKGTSPWLFLLIAVIILGVIGGGFYYAYDAFIKETPTPVPPIPQEPPPPVNNSPSVDTAPPTITDIVASPTENSMVVTWITSEPATSRVEYGESVDYDLTSILNEDLSNDHSITIDALESDTTYHFRVLSQDNTGNQAVSEDHIVTTLKSIVKREAEIITHDIVWESGGNYIVGIVKNTGDVSIESNDVTIFIEYESYLAEGESFQKKGSVNSEPAIIEPKGYTDFNISLEVINVKPSYKISIILSPE